MWEQDIEKNEYIYDCGSLQLAVNVGITGILVGFLLTLISLVTWFTFFDNVDHDLTLFAYQRGILNQFHFVAAIFASLGYVGIFSMKRSKVGIIFPLFPIISNSGMSAFLYLLFHTGLFTIEIYQFSSNMLGIVIALTSSLALLTLRKVSAKPQFLYLFVVFILIQRFIGDALWALISLFVPFEFTGGLGYLIQMLPYTIVSLVSTIFAINFFKLESRNGCFEENTTEDILFSE